MQKGQIALGVGTLILALALYFGGKTVTKEDSLSTTNKVDSFTFEEYETHQVAKLLAAEKTQQIAISDSLKAANSSDTSLLKKLYLHNSSFWKNIGNPALGSYYFYQYAKTEGSKDALKEAGDALVSAYKSTEDSTILNNLITFALRSYEDAVKKDGSDLELKIKLADAYVQGSQEPMKGIELLRQLSDSLPDNVPVLLALGRLSIQSGQYDKAKERLQKILKLEPQNTEALYFLAITEAQLGHDDEAVRLFEMCKLLVNNKDFNKEIDEIVKNLKNNKKV